MTDNLTIGIYGIPDINNSETATLSHDHALAVMKNGKILHQLQLERIDRKKYSKSMPEHIYALLKEKKLLQHDSNFVFVDNILGRSFINSQGNIRFEAPLSNHLNNGIEPGRLWFLDKPVKAYALNHELAHLGACLPFYGAFKENSLLIHYDGGASLSNFSAWHYKNGQIHNIEAHWKLKHLSALFNANAITFALVKAKMHDLNSVPGKFMGFASYGKYNPEIEHWLKANDFFKNHWKSKRAFFESMATTFSIQLKQMDQHHPFIQDIAATLHEHFVCESLKHFKRLQAITRAAYLYYSGGSALNLVLNTRLVNSGLFKTVYIPPCCNDSGLALGAAAFFEWQQNQKIKTHSPYLNNWGIELYKTSHTRKTIEATADLLCKKKVAGLCNGPAEIGPRALGNRSILSLANDKQLAAKVSRIHKKREWYRPVAPIMLEKNTRYFTGLKTIPDLAKYMLLDFAILPEKQNEIAGVVHVDGTSRIQTLFKRSDNPFMWDLLSWLDEKHGIKALINTSFNGKGEPIVHTINHALQSAMAMQLDAVILNGELKLLNTNSEAEVS